MPVNPRFILLKIKHYRMRIAEERPVLRSISHSRTLEKACKCKQPREIHTGVKPSTTTKTYKNLFLNYLFLQALMIRKNARKHHIYLNVFEKRLAGS